MLPGGDSEEGAGGEVIGIGDLVLIGVEDFLPLAAVAEKALGYFVQGVPGIDDVIVWQAVGGGLVSRVEGQVDAYVRFEVLGRFQPLPVVCVYFFPEVAVLIITPGDVKQGVTGTDTVNHLSPVFAVDLFVMVNKLIALLYGDGEFPVVDFPEAVVRDQLVERAIGDVL